MIINLTDNRKLSCEEYGDLNGIPIMLLHGSPGSRIWFANDDPVSHELGVRCICPERPGYGRSDFNPEQNFLSYSDDIRQLADKLELKNFFVLGVSGGGAFAAACAHELKDRVKAAALVSSTCPPNLMNMKSGMTAANRFSFWLAGNFPLALTAMSMITRWLIITKPQRYLNEIEVEFCPWDKKIFVTPEFQEMIMLHLKEAYAPGVKGAVHEMKLQSKDWGFKLSDINTPVRVWHGQEDTLAPHSMGQTLVNNLPLANFHSVPEAGHLLTDSPVMWKKILADLIKG